MGQVVAYESQGHAGTRWATCVQQRPQHPCQRGREMHQVGRGTIRGIVTSEGPDDVQYMQTHVVIF